MIFGLVYCITMSKSLMSQSEPAVTPLSSAVGRLFWMLFGPFSLALAAFYILSSGKGWATGADLVYLLIVAAMILGRSLEFRGGNPLTTDGIPATQEHLRRYIRMLAMVALVVWILVKVVGNYVVAA
jgi:hypothetical protein